VIRKGGVAIGSISDDGWGTSDKQLETILAQAFEGVGVPGMTGDTDANNVAWDAVQYIKPGEPDFVPVLLDWLEGEGYTISPGKSVGRPV